MARQIKVSIIADDANYRKGIQSSEKATQSFSGSIDGLTKNIVKNVVALGGGYLAFTKLTSVLKSSISAADQYNAVHKQMDAQLRAVGASVPLYSKAIDGLSKKMVDLGMNQTDVATTFTTLTRATGNASVAYNNMTLAANLTAASHKSLASVSLALGKFLDGNVNALGRIGIKFKSGTTLAQAYAEITKRVAGQAAAAETPLKKFHDQMTNLEIAIGEKLLPIMDKLVTWISNTVTKMQNSKRVQQDFKQGWDDIKKALQDAWTVAKDAFPYIQDFVGKMGGWAKTLEFLAGAFLAVKAGIIAFKIASYAMRISFIADMVAMDAALVSTGIGAAVVALGLAAAYVITHWKQVKKWFEDFMGWAKTYAPEIGAVLLGPLGFAAGEVIKHWETVKTWFTDFVGWLTELWNNPVQAIKNAFSDLGKGIFDSLKSGIDDFINAIKELHFHLKTKWGIPYGLSVSWGGSQGSSSSDVTDNATVDNSGPGAGAGGPSRAGAAAAVGSAGSTYSVGAGQKFVVSKLRSMGYSNADIKEFVNTMNYEDGSGRAGDQNTSFGPFQLHKGGQLPASVMAKGPAYAQQWAWSPAGLAYAASLQSGGKGLHGAALANWIGQHQGSTNPAAEARAALAGFSGSGGDGNGIPGTDYTTGANQSTVKTKKHKKPSFDTTKFLAGIVGNNLTGATHLGSEAGNLMKRGQQSLAVTALKGELADYDAAKKELEAKLKGASGKQKSAIQAELNKLGDSKSGLIGGVTTAITTTLAKITDAKNVKKLDAQFNTFSNKLAGETAKYTQLGLKSQYDTGAALMADYQAISGNLATQTSSLNAEKNKLTSELATATPKMKIDLKTKIASIKSKLATISGNVTSNLQNIASALQSQISQTQGNIGNYLSNITNSALTALGNQYYQNGALTPLEAQLKQMQDQDQAQSYQDSIDQANAQLQTDQSGGADAGTIQADQKAIVAANRAQAEYNLGIQAAQQRADEDTAYANQSVTLQNKMSALSDAVQTGSQSIDGPGGLADVLGGFGISLSAVGDINDPSSDLSKLSGATNDLAGEMTSLAAVIGQITGTTPTTVKTKAGTATVTPTSAQLAVLAAAGRPGGLSSNKTQGVYSVHAKGGHGTTFGPHLFLAGEAGPEDYIFAPHSQGGMGALMGGGDLHVTFTGNINASSQADIDRLADRIHQSLLRKQRKNSTLGFR